MLVSSGKTKHGILMNTVSLNGMLAIGIVFLTITLGITILAIVSPTPYLSSSPVGLWGCDTGYTGETFNADQCKGWDSYGSLNKEIENLPIAKLVMGPFGTLNKDFTFSLVIKNVFTTSADPRVECLWHYSTME